MSNSAAFSITIQSSQTLLATTAGNLASGASIDVSSAGISPLPPFLYSDSVTWQAATVKYDPTRKQVHAVGKVASSLPYEHYIYSETTNTWGANTKSLTNFGHYWTSAFDPATGEYYHWFNAGPTCYRYIPGTGWTTISETGTGYPGAWTYPTAIGWHPNLFGAGDGGLVLVGGANNYAWRKSTNTWSTISTGLTFPGGSGDGAYDAANDKLWVGTGSSPGRAAIVSAGSGGTVGSVQTPSNPPALVYGGGGGGDTTNKVIAHPGNTGKLLLLLSNVTTNNVYESTNSGATWSLAAYNHPLSFPESAGQWTCGSIAAYGVVWGISSRGSRSRLWKPPV